MEVLGSLCTLLVGVSQVNRLIKGEHEDSHTSCDEKVGEDGAHSGRQTLLCALGCLLRGRPHAGHPPHNRCFGVFANSLCARPCSPLLSIWGPVRRRRRQCTVNSASAFWRCPTDASLEVHLCPAGPVEAGVSGPPSPLPATPPSALLVSNRMEQGRLGALACHF